MSHKSVDTLLRTQLTLYEYQIFDMIELSINHFSLARFHLILYSSSFLIFLPSVVHSVIDFILPCISNS